MTTPERLELPDGRRLDVWVDPAGADTMPLVFHHGTPSSGKPLHAVLRAARTHGLQLVTASRPGYGDSTRQPGRQVVDVVADTTAVLDMLGTRRCVVAGWSGGGPHALACGARLADKVAAVLVIAGVAPYTADGLDWLAGMGEDNVAEFGHALEGEASLREFLDAMEAQMGEATVTDFIAGMATLLPEVDRAAMSDEFGEDLLAAHVEAVRNGIDGWLDDDLAFGAPWGFELDEVTAPTMLWQGSLDKMVPFDHGTWLAANIPGVVAHLEQGEGHLSIGVGAIDRMLDELVVVAG